MINKKPFIVAVYDLVFYSRGDEDWDAYFDKKIKVYKQTYETRFDSFGTMEYYKDLCETAKEILGVDSFSNLKILELGAGVGLTSVLMASGGADATLVDTSKKANQLSKIHVDVAKKKYKQIGPIKIVNGNFFNLKLRHNYFDLVQNYGVIEHFSDKDILRTLTVMKRCCKKGGFVIIGVPNFFSLEFASLCRKGKGSERYLSKKRLKELVKLAGFRKVKVVTSSHAYTHFMPGWFVENTASFERFLGKSLGMGFLNIVSGKK